jgi:TPR repeat protein
MSARALPEVPRVPVLLERACEIAKNVSALECLGVLRDHQGDHARAHKAWKKAAVLGSAVGQFKLGEIFYRGLGNHGVDGEEALFWLSKAVKNSSSPLAVEDLSTAACIMGYLFQDGEGTQACNVTAVKWFRVASTNGNVEATKTLGWLYNTGQY